MNSNPFPAAFVNCKASMQVIPITIPGGSAVAEWRVDCLTEQQHVAHMTKAMDDIMTHSFTSNSSSALACLLAGHAMPWTIQFECTLSFVAYLPLTKKA